MEQFLFALCVALLGGLLLSRAANYLKLPAVTPYLIAGILVGPYLLGAIGVEGLGFTHESIKGFSLFADAALGFIAFAIGNEFRVSHLKKTGKQATVIGIFQAVVTTLVVDAVLILLHLAMPDVLSLPAALILGAIASATAPAATLMVVRQYKAKGPVTDILLPIVALDDAVGLVLFSVSFGVAKALISGQIDLLSVVLEPVLEVVLSLVLGFLIGLVFTFIEQFFRSRAKRVSLSVAFVLLAVGLSMLEFHIGRVHIAFSSLLVCMMLGTVFCNFCKNSEVIMEQTERWTAPLLVLFFVISGAELELSVFKSFSIVLIGLVYILCRAAGKYFGASFSAKTMKCDSNITKYLGVTLLPQAGVALGMAFKASQLGGADGAMVLNITLFAVLIYELVGPMLTKIVLLRAGEIAPENASPERRSLRRTAEENALADESAPNSKS
jgi:Kef-type K+ transport system membrane component KefB